MRTMLVVLGVSLLLLDSAHAAKAVKTSENMAAEGKICHYADADGFTYHYLVPKGYFATPPCSPSIETPFGPPPRGYAVFIRDEVPVNDSKNRICHYGLRGRLIMRTIANDDRTACWFAVIDDSEPRSGFADLVREERLPGTDTKLCYYALDSANPRRIATHYLSDSIFGPPCTKRVQVP